MPETIIKLKDLSRKDVPADLRAETYFNFTAHPFDHQKLFDQTNSIFGALQNINKYANLWLSDTINQKQTENVKLSNKLPDSTVTQGHFNIFIEEGAVFMPSRIIGSQTNNNHHFIYIEKNAKVIGADIYLDKASIYIGSEANVETSAGITGPAIIGKRTEIRQGAYVRGDCIIGNDCVIRGELKNIVIMDKGSFSHPSYLGDSICGYKTHFGNQVTAANFGIFEGIREDENFKSIIVECEGSRYDLGEPKMGICMGDFCQIGCNSVSDPATFLKPYTIVYALSRIPKGFYGPYEILKNKPLEHGVIERFPFKM
jgi:NDP-sugar pyrophosphorylase family protein